MVKFCLILLLLSSGLFSNIYLEKFNTENYPIITADFYRFDKEPLNTNLLFVFEQGNADNIIKIDTINSQNLKSLNSYIVIDISNSMSKYNDEVNMLLSSFIESMSLTDSLGIITYNQSSIIRCAKTNSKEKLLRSINSINYFGSNNLVELFFNSPFSIEKIAEEGEDYILITDKEGFGNFDSISNLLTLKKIILHTIQIENIQSSKFEGVTNGYYLKPKNFSDNFNLLTYYLLNKLKNDIYYKLYWESNECSDLVKGNIVEAPNYSYEFSYYIDSIKTKLLHINPNLIKVENIEVGKEIKRNISLTSLKRDLDILSISSSNNKILVNYNFSKILKNESKSFEIAYTPTDNTFINSKILIETQCNLFEIPIEFGESKSSSNGLTLSVVNSSMFFRGDTINFQVHNKLINDTLLFEYKYNNQWYIGLENITDNNFKWKIPNITPQNLEFRISFKNTDYKQFDEKVITLWGSNPRLTKLSFDKNLCAFIGEDDRLYCFKITNPDIGGSIASNLKNFKDFSISKNNENIAVINAKKIIIFDSDGADSPIELFEQADSLSKLDYNYQDNLLVSGNINGRVSIYSSINDNSSPTNEINLFQSKISLIKSNPKKNIFAFVSSKNELEVSLIENNLNFKRVFYKQFENAINNVEWSGNGDSLYVSTSNNNLLYLLTFVQNTYNLIEIKNNIFNNISSFSTSGFESGLIFNIIQNKINILNQENNILDSVAYNQLKNTSLSNSFFTYNYDFNKLKILDLNKYKNTNYQNTLVFSDLASVTLKYLPFKDINMGDICNNLPIDTTVTSYIYNNFSRYVIIDSIKIENSSKNLIDINLNKFLFPKANNNINVSIIPNELGNFKSKVTFFSSYDTFNINLNYSVIDDDIIQNQTYFKLPDVLVGDSIDISLGLFQSIPSTNKINKIVYDLDDENIIVSIVDSVLKNENFKFQFKPTNIEDYQESIRIYSQNACTPFNFTIYGSGVAPKLDIDKIYEIDTIFCSDNALNDIALKNYGNGRLIIENIYTSNSNLDFSINSSTINQNENLNISFSLNKLINGNYIDTIFFKIRGLMEGKNMFKLPIKYSIFILEMEHNDTLDFGSSNLNQAKQLPFTIKNISNLNEEVKLSSINNENYFEILNNNLVINKQDSVNFQINFKGGSENKVYQELFKISGQCEYDTVLFSIDLRDNSPILSSFESFIFEDVYCNSITQNSSITIKNTGKKVLEIFDIQLLDGDNENFNLSDWSSSISIQPNQDYLLNINFTPNEPKNYNSKIIIKSNSKLNNGEDTINLFANYYRSSLSISNEELLYSKVESNKVLKDTFLLYNNGNLIEDLLLSNSNSKLIFNNLDNSSVNINDSTRIELIYSGGLPDDIILDTLQVQSKCEVYKIPVSIFVKGTNYFEIYSKNSNAKTGDIIEIPIFFSNPENLIVNVPFQVKSELVVNKNILNIDNSYIEGDFRIIPISFEVNSLTTFNVLNLSARVTLGNSDTSIITFRNTEIIDNPKYYFENTISKLKIENICEEGSIRYVEGGSTFELLPIYPNPANNLIYIEYKLIEDGYVELYLTDNEGKIIKYFINNKVSAHSKTISFNTEFLVPGVYFINLLTNNNKITRKFLLIR